MKQIIQELWETTKGAIQRKKKRKKKKQKKYLKQ